MFVHSADSEEEGGRIVHNKAFGHLLRTKLDTTLEGGVAVGYAMLDSPLLY